MSTKKKTEAKSKKKTRKLAEYKPVKPPKTPHPKGLFALKAAHGKKLGVTCLICKTKLGERKGVAGGRKPFLCEKRDCFKAMRRAYRYDWEHDKLKKPLPKPKAVKAKKPKAEPKKAA